MPRLHGSHWPNDGIVSHIIARLRKGHADTRLLRSLEQGEQGKKSTAPQQFRIMYVHSANT